MLCCDRQNYVHSFICCFFTTIKRKQVNLNNQFVYIRLATLQIVAVFSGFFFQCQINSRTPESEDWTLQLKPTFSSTLTAIHFSQIPLSPSKFELFYQQPDVCVHNRLPAPEPAVTHSCVRPRDITKAQKAHRYRFKSVLSFSLTDDPEVTKVNMELKSICRSDVTTFMSQFTDELTLILTS